jgi:hypothetical protein
VDRSLNAPPIRITGVPRPVRSIAMGVPSAEATVSMVMFTALLLVAAWPGTVARHVCRDVGAAQPVST